MEGRRAHIAANMRGMSVRWMADGQRMKNSEIPHYTLLHPLNHDLLTQTTCARPNPHFSLHTQCVFVRGWGACKGMGCVVEKEQWEYKLRVISSGFSEPLLH